MKQKALAIILALCMVISMLPATVFAAPAMKSGDVEVVSQLAADMEAPAELTALPELPAETDAGKYKISAKVVKGSSHGEIELSASTANAQEVVYLTANPDDGYVVELGGSYKYYYYQMEIVYIGMDIYEITMPDGDVSLEIKFVAAEGSNHTVNLSVNNTEFGTAEASRTQAKEGESVLVAALAAEGYYLDSIRAVDANGEDALGAYLGTDEDGVDYFEFIMPATALTIELVFEKMVPHHITIDTFFEDEIYGTAYVDNDYLMAGEQFYLYIDLVPRMKVSVIDTRSDEGYVPVTWVSAGKWTGIMPNCDLHIMISIEKDMRIFNVDVSGNAYGQYYNDRHAQVGETVGLRFYPNEGYRGIILDDDGIEDIVWTGSDYFTFTMPKRDVNMVIAFVESQKPITLSVGKNGTASVSHTKAEEGELVTLTCNPDEGYKVDKITGVEGLVDNGDNTYTFPMPFRDVNLSVTFKKLYEAVNVVVDTGIGGTAVTDVAEAKLGDVVTLTCAPEEGYRVAQITGVSDLTDNGDNTYTFTMPDEEVALHVLFLRHENPFLDVNETHFFYDPVLWAVGEGITNGIDETHFGPFMTSNRAAVVTMLWRWAGSPEPTTTENPFEDVPADSWYTKPVLWAVENGITNGASPTQFAPNSICNRAQVVTFLYRYLNSPSTEGVENPFEDVPAGEWYEAPVLWALENGITTGATATTFDPNGQCLRAQFVTFLYRASLTPGEYDLHWVINGFQDTPSDCGTVTLSHERAKAGETITAIVIPAEGYVIDWVACELGTPVTQVSDTEYTFVMPDHAEYFHVNFVEIPVEPTEPEPTDPTEPTEPEEPDPTEPTEPEEPDPTEPTDPEEPDPTDPTDPTEPAETYAFVLKDNGFGTVSYKDKMEGVPGESIFFYAIPDEGYYLSGVEIFNPDNAIDVSKVLVYAYEDNLYELVMIDHDVIMTCVFSPLP